MIRALWTLLLVCFLSPIMTQGALAKTVQLKRTRIIKTAKATQVVFEFSGKFRFHYFSLQDPERLVIDVSSAKSKISSKKVSQQIDYIGKFRIGDKHRSFLRLVFDLTHPVSSHVTMMAAGRTKPDRLVVTLPPSKAAMSSHHTKKAKSTIKKPKVVKTLPKVVTKRDVIVVIDPGHGGKDPGARGAHGAREKTVVLQIARRLQKLINKEPGFKAILTRRGDYYIGLRQRLALAHKYKADMFVAIHADAYRHQRAHGASVYALSERGATSEAARWLAQRENESEFVGGLDLADKDHLLRSVLIDLSQTHTISASLQMGTAILHQLSKFADLHHEGVEQAAFVVLKSPDIPSLLVETGFLSNPQEERKLTNTHYQQRVAKSVVKGIKGYFISHPPIGTRLAHVAHQQRQHHRA